MKQGPSSSFETSWQSAFPIQRESLLLPRDSHCTQAVYGQRSLAHATYWIVSRSCKNNVFHELFKCELPPSHCPGLFPGNTKCMVCHSLGKEHPWCTSHNRLFKLSLIFKQVNFSHVPLPIKWCSLFVKMWSKDQLSLWWALEFHIFLLLWCVFSETYFTGSLACAVIPEKWCWYLNQVDDLF